MGKVRNLAVVVVYREIVVRRMFWIACVGVVLAAGLLDTATSIKFLGIGSGQAAWDVLIPPVQFADNSLDNEYFRKEPENIQHVSEVIGTATSGTVTTLIDTGLTQTLDDFFAFLELKITAGANAGESRLITAYNGTTKEITVKDAFP